MAILDRWIVKVRPGKAEAWKEFRDEAMVVSERLSLPNLTSYSYISGSHAMGTIVDETLWESFAEMEAWYQKADADLGWQALAKKYDDIVESTHVERLTKLESS